MPEEHYTSPAYEAAPAAAPEGNTLASKVVVAVVVIWIASFGLIALYKSLQPVEGATRVVSPFQAWDGEWEGEHATFDEAGREIERVEVRQRFRHVVAGERFEQEGYFEVTDPETGKTEIERVLNSAEYDGSDLHRMVIKQKGSVVQHYDGEAADGGFTWTRDVPLIREMFEERMEGDVYTVEGWGLYGDPETAEPVTMRGEYRRVVEE